MEEAQEEAVACQARADYCWAIGDDDRAEEHVAACATQQARARVLSTYLATIEPTGVLDPEVRRAEPDRQPTVPDVRAAPRFIVHTNPGATRG